jgi:hypothetical protein
MKISTVLFLFSVFILCLSFFKVNCNGPENKILSIPKEDQELNIPGLSTDDIYSSLFNEPTDYLRTFEKKNPSENNWISQIL